jgi:glutathione reductase (NADPH)
MVYERSERLCEVARNFDLVVIGTGSAASAAAFRCRSAGWKVAVVDSRPFGGTCALRGCDPKKVLVGAADLLDWARRMGAKGAIAGEVKIDWPGLIRFKRSFTEPVPARKEEAFAKAKIATLSGHARFIDRSTVKVGSELLKARYFLIATGAAPKRLDLPGEELLTTSEEFLELERLPERVLFVGGGYISFEFAHVAARAGARARIVHRGERPLERFDPDLVERLLRASADAGIDVQLGTGVEAIERIGRNLVVRAAKARMKETYQADLVVHGAGRAPDIDDLGLDKAGVEFEARGVRVNEYLQSVSHPRVYAAGDVAASPGLPLTPVASLEGRVAAANMLEGNRHRPDYAATPTVVFTIPPLAAVGLDERGAKERGLKFKVSRGDTSTWYSSRRVGARHTGYKVLVEEGSDRILGAHLFGPQAEETINLFALAIRFGIKARALKEMRYAYPTHADDISYMLPG